jgi:hypothetical protein
VIHIETDIGALQMLPQAEPEATEWPCTVSHLDDDDDDE